MFGKVSKKLKMFDGKIVKFWITCHKNDPKNVMSFFCILIGCCFLIGTAVVFCRASLESREHADTIDDGGDEGITVSQNGTKKGRRYDKQMACMYCNKLIKLNMPRHLVRAHGSEFEVAKLLAYSNKNQKLLGFARLTNRGNFLHNYRVMESGEGELIVGREANKEMTLREKIDAYLPCAYCCVMYLKHDLWRHAKRCRFRTADNTTAHSIVGKSRMIVRGALNQDTANVDQKFRCDILEGMRSDEVTDVVMSDALILKYGADLYLQLGRIRAHDISQRMRQLARLLMTFRTVNQQLPDTVSLSQLLTGHNFDDVVNATRLMCNPVEQPTGRPLYSNPSIGLKLGHSLVKCCEIKKGQGIRMDCETDINEADAFLTLHKNDWLTHISKTAHATFKLRRHNMPQQQPSATDLLKLKNYHASAIEMLTDRLTKIPAYATWRKLCEVLFSRLVVFNRRRSGETAKLLLSAFINRPKWEQAANDDMSSREA